MESALRDNIRIIVGGDFNGKLSLSDAGTAKQKEINTHLENFVISCNLHDTATHWGSIMLSQIQPLLEEEVERLDYIFTSDTSGLTSAGVNNISGPPSSHAPIFAKFDLSMWNNSQLMNFLSFHPPPKLVINTTDKTNISLLGLKEICTIVAKKSIQPLMKSLKCNLEQRITINYNSEAGRKKSLLSWLRRVFKNNEGRKNSKLFRRLVLKNTSPKGAPTCVLNKAGEILSHPQDVMDRSNEYFSELFHHDFTAPENKPWLHIPIWTQYQEACRDFLSPTGRTRPLT